MAELTERIPIDSLKFLQKMKLEDHCKFADKKNTRLLILRNIIIKSCSI